MRLQTGSELDLTCSSISEGSEEFPAREPKRQRSHPVLTQPGANPRGPRPLHPCPALQSKLGCGTRTPGSCRRLPEPRRPGLWPHLCVSGTAVAGGSSLTNPEMRMEQESAQPGPRAAVPPVPPSRTWAMGAAASLPESRPPQPQGLRVSWLAPLFFNRRGRDSPRVSRAAVLALLCPLALAVRKPHPQSLWKRLTTGPP